MCTPRTYRPGMTTPEPSLGSTVLYILDEQDAAAANKRRADFDAHRKTDGYTDTGYVAHYGNEAHAGDVCPAIIVRVWSDGTVNAAVRLDGTDSLWVTSRHQGDEPGQWHWPPRTLDV